jgi:hypothetical protein
MNPLAVIEYSELTDGIVATFESGVSDALPVAGAILAAFLVVKTVKRVIGV